MSLISGKNRGFRRIKATVAGCHNAAIVAPDTVCVALEFCDAFGTSVCELVVDFGLKAGRQFDSSPSDGLT